MTIFPRRIFIIVLMFMLMFLVISDGRTEEPVGTWLCLGEYGASVSRNDDGARLSSDSFTNNQKILIDERGLRNFGDDDIELNKCNFVKGRPVLCKRDDNSFGGTFYMNSDYVFLWHLMRIVGDTDSDYLIIGRCSKLIEVP